MEFDESVLVPRANDVKVGVSVTGQHMTLHCANCNTVMGDSLSVCGEIEDMDLIMCLKVTNDIIISNAKELGGEGGMANCIYSFLKCGRCRSTVGKLIHSAPSGWASARSIFLLHKANILCYTLNSRSMVKASLVSFHLMPLGPYVHEVKKQFQIQLDRMLEVKNRLEDSSSCSSSSLSSCVK